MDMKEALTYYPNVLSFAMSLTRDLPKAKDLTQEAYLRLHTHAGKYVERGALQGYLFTIVRHAHYQQYRRAFRLVFVDEIHELLKDSAEPNQDYSVELQDTLAAIEDLAPRHREILELAILGTSYEDIAAKLKIPLGTVKSRIRRARISLQTILGENDAEANP